MSHSSRKGFYRHTSLITIPSDFPSASPVPTRSDSPNPVWTSSRTTPQSRGSRTSPLRFNESYVLLEDDSEALSNLYNQRVETCSQLMEQLDVSIRRHEGLLSYVKSLQVHLNQNSNIARADLKNRFNSSITELTALYDDALNQMEMTVKEKETTLFEKATELENFVLSLTEVQAELELRLKAEPKATFVQRFREHVEKVKTALKEWAGDINITGEFLAIPTQMFRVSTTHNSPVNMSRTDPLVDVSVQTEIRDSPQIDTHHEGSLDSLQSNLLLDFQQLELKRQEIMKRSMPLLTLSDQQEDSIPPLKTVIPCKRCAERRHRSRRVHTERTDDTERRSIDVMDIQERVEVYRKDAIILDLVKRYRELETLYEWAKHGADEKDPGQAAVEDLMATNERMAKRIE